VDQRSRQGQTHSVRVQGEDSFSCIPLISRAETLIDSLVLAETPRTKREPFDGSPLSAIEIPGLVELRAQAWRVRITSTYFDREPTFEESVRLLVQHPFDFLAYLETSLAEDLAFNLEKLPWWSDLQHRITLLLALICAAPRRGFPSKAYYQVEGYRHNVYLETVRYCKEVIKPLDPEIADYLISNVVALFGLPFPEDASRVEAEQKGHKCRNAGL